MTDPKQGERDYYARIGPVGIAHSRRKPFVEEQCAFYFANFSALLCLLPPSPQRILDFGCGTGWLSLLVAQAGHEVTGVDIAPEAIAAAREDAAARGLTRARFEVGDYESFSPAAPFDFVLFYDALHHAESELDALRAAHAALRPGGAVITCEPGTGHADASASRDAVHTFGVHEKDMPPSHIVATGRAAGFTRHLVLPRPFDVSRTFFRPAYHRAATQSELFGRRLLGFLRFLPRAWRVRDQGIVLLWK